MEGFNFTNEEIVFIYRHLQDYENVIQNNLLKQLKFTEGQLELSEKVYGKDADFDREEYNLQIKLVKDELPKAINERLNFINQIKEKFADAYSIISDVDPDFVENVTHAYFSDSDAAKNLFQQLKNKNNGYKD